MAVMMEAEKLRAEGADLMDFGAGEPDFPTPENGAANALFRPHNGSKRAFPNASPGAWETVEELGDESRRPLRRYERTTG